MLDLAVKHDIVKKSGTWYSYGEERIGQGRENAKQFLTENSNIAKDVEKEGVDSVWTYLRGTPGSSGAAEIAVRMMAVPVEY